MLPPPSLLNETVQPTLASPPCQAATLLLFLTFLDAFALGNGAYDVDTIGGDDTALIFFNGQNDFTNGLPICEQQPAVGTQITLVGFGCNDYPFFDDCAGDGIKRTGTSDVVDQPNTPNTIEIMGPIRDGDGTRGFTASGDSGSPYILFQQSRPCISAVESGGAINDTNGNGRPDNGDINMSFGASLHNTSSRTFLAGQLPGVDCDVYETNCLAMFVDLHRSVYRRPPATATTTMFDARLRGNQTTLWQIASGLREALLLIWWP